MENGQIIWFLLIFTLLIIYIIYTIRYFLVVRKSLFFSGKIKVLHLVLIWLIPFIWIFILKNLTKSTPGSYEGKNKDNYKPFSDNDNDANRASNMGF
jgi:hypothetical protein